VGAEAQLLAAAMLECFPSNVNAGPDLLGDPQRGRRHFKGAVVVHPTPRRRRAIGINDVAGLPFV